MMKKRMLILAAVLLALVTLSAQAAFPDQITGYQAKTRSWQHIQYGAYPTGANGETAPIVWRVLGVNGQQAYLLSEYILFAHRVDPNCYPTNKETAPYGGWETSELRQYLNEDFLKAAFTEVEQAALLLTPDGALVSLPEIADLKNKDYGFSANKLRQAQSTDYAKANGLYVYQGAKKYSPYWSRTPSDSKTYAHRRVMDDGKLGYICVEVQNLGVRPVICLNLSLFKNFEGEGTVAEPFKAIRYAEEKPAAESAEAAEKPEEPAGEPERPAEPAEAGEKPEAPAAASDARFPTAYPSLFPALTEEGFLPAGEPEFVYKDEKAGLWLYASQDVRLEIVRKEGLQAKNRPWRWFEADIFARPGSDEYMRVFYHEDNPKAKKTVEIKKIARENHLVFAMNADWYYYRVQRNAKKKVMPVGIILRRGEVLYDDPAKKLWTTIPNRDILAFYPNGGVEVYDYNGITADELKAKGASDVLSFGPVLLSGGEVTEQTKTISAKQNDNPRSGIGMVEPGHYVSIIMEGRRGRISVGCKMTEFAELFRAKGCSVAYNLDGGGTASMMFMGDYLNEMGQYTADARKQVEVLGIGVSDAVQ